MAPSPTDGSSRRSLIRELSESLNKSRSQLPMPTSPAQESATKNSLPAGNMPEWTLDSFNPEEDDVVQSTRQFEDTFQSQPEHKIRSTAKKYKYWQPPQPEQHIDTSMVRREFNDFSFSASEQDSHSIEMARAPRGSLRNTPSKLAHKSPDVSLGNDSLYGLSPQARTRPATRKDGDASARDSLRRDATLRRATSLPQKELENISSRSARNSPLVSPNKQAKFEKRRSTLAQMHNKVASEEDESYIDERPPTTTLTAKNPRFANPRSRQTSENMNDISAAQSRTPQRSMLGTPRTKTGSATQQSFVLPDLPNLTELMSGQYKDGTPVFGRSARARSRFVSAPIPYRSNDEPPHIPVDNIPIPQDEKAIFASLQLLQERLAQVEQEKAEVDKKVEEFEVQVGELKAEMAVNERRGSDSALGSTDGEGSKAKKSTWSVEKINLESRVESLRNRAERAERKVSVTEISNKRLTQERDNLLTQLGVAFFNAEEIKGERDALQNENSSLREEVDALRTENDDLRARLAEYEDESQRLQAEADRGDKTIRKENETMRLQLEKAEAAQAEHARLQDEHEALEAKVNMLKKQREEDAKKRASKEAELRSRIARRDETIQNFQDMTQATDTLQHQNEELRTQLDQLAAEREAQEQQWLKKEARLKRKSEDAIREAQESTKELLDFRRAGSQPKRQTNLTDGNALQPRTSGGRSGKNTQARIFDGVIEEIQSNTPPSSNRLYASRNKQAQASKSLPKHASGRSSSAPQVGTGHTIGEISDAESTTDLSVMKRTRPTTRVASAHPTNQAQEPTGDLTYLSVMDPDEIAGLRKTLEEERIANRNKSSAPSSGQIELSQLRKALEDEKAAVRKGSAPAPPSRGQDDTVRSETRSQSLPTKAFPKDLTTGSHPMDLTESITGRVISVNAEEQIPLDSLPQQDSKRSNKSITHRRNRSAPVEMTSAFILPDITIQARDALKADTHAEPHQGENCTVCQPEPAKIKAPAPIPVTDRVSNDDPDVTMRPSQPPPLALAAVIKALNDELAHLNIRKSAYDALLRRRDPSFGRRERKSVEAKITDLLQTISTKSDQIYALYDVLEGQKQAGQLQSGTDQTTEMDEKEVEDTLLSVGLDPDVMREMTAAAEPLPQVKSNKGKAKKVVIEDQDSETEELPWEGLSETESLPDYGRFQRR
ncbi:hypothetical protein K490DRAFT_61271 [Saccharata proteae CBS 121410]|uniref:Cep57 centrosome microtubule-binding domain-containing protein n=1 Tax=Saccharata proteae CBS 121410 TaxID=1314787 RepID=A0A9P4M238_9PEZI|nr:hypothetical protein K490DRAFT_61271 [Saccharata proteae CBS 121410]